MSYLIVKCPYCENRFITTSETKARCRYCSKGFTIKPKRKPSRVLAVLGSQAEARMALLEGM